ncbi:dead end protein homolog 1 [Caerostris darwini]|uniref:Dead end protein homolog 1 n=1 Tax=Caerostris darwini TaxID=1538125 RepID=A0AAV4MD69_9ARAC|nr:dead end protein homolog 1 [Caerostris darwini]
MADRPLVRGVDKEADDKFFKVNGQIVSGPPSQWNGPPPARECEVYIGNLPGDVFPNELLDYCKAIGYVYHLRFLKDGSVNSKGSAYVIYANNGMAEKAVASMNNMDVRPCVKITVMKAVDFLKLCSVCKARLSGWKYPINIINKNHHFVQVNGNRLFGPPSYWKGAEPPKECKLLIGNIPNDVFENEVLSLLESVGTVYQFQFMISSNGHTRGYAYCTYTNLGDAVKAIQSFNNFEIRPLSNISVVATMDNNILYAGFVALDKTGEEIYGELRKFFGGITSVAPYVIPQRNCLAIEVKFESHLFSSYARDFLLSGCVHLFGKRLTAVCWANYNSNNVATEIVEFGK